MIAGIVACADVGGFYQKLHQTPPVESLAGAYMLSVESRFAAVSPIVLAGSANGSAFHTVHGTFDRSGSRLTVAFPSGLMNGTLADERITWDGGDVWLLQATPAWKGMRQHAPLHAVAGPAPAGTVCGHGQGVARSFQAQGQAEVDLLFLAYC